MISDSVFFASLLLPVLPLDLSMPGPGNFLPKPFERNQGLMKELVQCDFMIGSRYFLEFLVTFR